MKYRPEIDGLRAFAVLPVVLFHSGLEYFGGGFVGVDVFFVISGYLITSIILDGLKRGDFSFAEFYERRARRIFPALYFVVIVSVPIAWFWLDPFALKEFFQSVAATALFSSNVFFYLKTGYFDTAAELKPLLHTWSLAVEEQYYVLFPVVMLISWRFRMKVIYIIFVSTFLASLFIAQSLLESDPSASFFLLHARAWELLAGAILALYLSEKAESKSSALDQFGSVFGLILIISSVLFFRKEMTFPGLSAVPPVLGTALVILFAKKGTLANTFLSFGFLVKIGLVSYSAYLWHQPIFSFFREISLREPTALEVSLCVLATFALAAVTKVSVEDYFRYRFLKGRRRLFVAAILPVALITLVVGVYGHTKNGFPERNQDFLRLAQNPGFGFVCSGADFDESRCYTGDGSGAIVWGDSYAMHLVRALELVHSDGVRQVTLSACPPVVGYDKAPRKSLVKCEDFNESVLSALREHSKSLSGTMVYMSSSMNFGAEDVLHMSERTIRELLKLGYRVRIVSPPPFYKGTERCIASVFRGWSEFDSCEFSVQDIENAEHFDSLRDLSERMGVEYIDLRRFVCQGQRCSVASDEGVLFYRDNGHLSNEAAPVLADYISRAVER